MENLSSSSSLRPNVEGRDTQLPYRKREEFSHFETFNYLHHENALWEEDENQINSKPYLLYIIVLTIHILVGIMAGLFGTVLQATIYSLTKLKNHFLNDSLEKYQTSSLLPVPLIFWLILNVIPVVISSVLVTYVEPKAIGSGIPLVKCYLNGVYISGVVEFKTLVIKMIGIILAMVGTLPGGDEGPMIHIGAIIGALTCEYTVNLTENRCNIFRHFRKKYVKRDLMLSGVAAALASSFGAPIGSLLLALEEAASFWSGSLIINAFISSTISSFLTANLLSALFAEHVLFYGEFNVKGLENMEYEYSEIPVFALIGVIGGLLGSLWIKIFTLCMKYRSKYLKTKPLKVLEAGLFSAVFTAICFALINLFKECVTKSDLTKSESCLPSEEHQMTKLILSKPFQNIRYLLTSSGEYKIRTLAVYTLFYYVASAIGTGLNTVIGNFIPLILLGAAWGRWLAEVAKHFFPEAEEFIHPGKYALIGAAAQVSGVLRMTVSLSVLLLESTGTAPSFFLAIVVAIFCAKWTGDYFTESIYEILLKKVPMLPWQPLDCLMNREVGEIMNKPAICVLLVEKASYIHEILTTTTHHGFPVVKDTEMEYRSDGVVIGFVLREYLVAMLQHKLFEHKQHIWDKNFIRILQNAERNRLRSSTILDLLPEEMDNTLNFGIVMNQAPFWTTSNCSVPELYAIFRGLGLRHVVIVDNTNRAVGIVTRKDFLCNL